MNATRLIEANKIYWICVLCLADHPGQAKGNLCCSHLVAENRPLFASEMAKPYAKKKHRLFPQEAHRNTRGNRTY